VSEYAVPRIRGERLFATLAIAAAALVLAAVAILALPSLLRITRIEVRGAAAMTRNEVLEAALVREGASYFETDAARVRAALEADPRVDRASVARRFPNGLAIAIEERRPVATVLVEADGLQSPAYLDAKGVAFALAGGAECAYRAPGTLPVLSGIRIENFRPGARLPAELVAPLAALGQLGERESALLAAFSEIKVWRSRYGEVELLLYPMRHRVPVRTGPTLSAQDLRSILLVLDVMGSKGMDTAVSELDFRTGTVVYRGKEGHPD